MKKYESKSIYSKKYNGIHKSIRISKELHDELKKYTEKKNVSIKDFIEKLIFDSISI